MKTISIKLDPSLAQWLSRRAEKMNRTTSDLVREALEHQRTAKARPNCHDLMQHLCGSIHGPGDLSTNPKHLEGFGK